MSSIFVKSKDFGRQTLMPVEDSIKMLSEMGSKGAIGIEITI